MTSSVPPVSDAGSVSDARLDELIAGRGPDVFLHEVVLVCRELRQLRALAEERRLGPREG